MTRGEAAEQIYGLILSADDEEGPCIFSDQIEALEMAIEALKQPEIVHCNECKCCLRADPHELWCQGHGYPAHLVAENDFCSKGRRIKEEE